MEMATCSSTSSIPPRVAKVLHDARFLTDWSMAVSPDGRQIVWAQVDARAVPT